MSATLGYSYVLPCGATLPNRLAKAAMSEALGGLDGAPTPALETLYRRFVAGGVGLALTGNVMIEHAQRGEPGNVVLEDDRALDAFKAWARAGSGPDTVLWMQLNHPGRQAPRSVAPAPVAPSAVPLPPSAVFAPPRALSGAEIEGLVAKFARSAALAQQAGFGGVQLHGAHGYLVSQFLSPLTNLREDEWGGSPEKRRRFLLAVVAAMREAVGPFFPIGVKLNSADFMRGGQSEDEALEVVQALEAARIDLLEISGGTYQAPAMMGGRAKAGREAYFLAFAERARSRVKTPLMLTGGFRSAAAMRAAIEGGAVDVIGLARPLAVTPDLPRLLLDGRLAEAPAHEPVRLGIGRLDGYLDLAWHAQQLQRMGRGLEPDLQRPAWLVAMAAAIDNGGELVARLAGQRRG